MCLRHCRSPIGSLFHYASFKGPARDLRVGMHHGLYCIGCCWGLMIILVAVGTMNIAVMAALAAVILIEKIWKYGRPFATVVGVTLIVLAVLALFVPRLLPGLQPMAADVGPDVEPDALADALRHAFDDAFRHAVGDAVHVELDPPNAWISCHPIRASGPPRTGTASG